MVRLALVVIDRRFRDPYVPGSTYRYQYAAAERNPRGNASDKLFVGQKCSAKLFVGLQTGLRSVRPSDREYQVT
jgi:hypothetical protein